MKFDKSKKEILEDVFLIIFIMFIVILCWLCQGCKTYHVVELEVHDTLVVRDSINVTDTVVHTRVEKEIIENNTYHEVTSDYAFGKFIKDLGYRVDTVKRVEKIIVDNNTYKSVVDSLMKALSYYNKKDSLSTHNQGKTEKDIIEKPLTLYQNIIMAFGEVFFYIIVIALVGTAAYFTLKKCSKKKE